MWSTGLPQFPRRSGFSSCSAGARHLWPTGLLALRHAESCQTRDCPMFPALADGFLTTGPPRKSGLCVFLKLNRVLKEACSLTLFFLIHTTAPCVLIENLIHLYLKYLLIGNAINTAFYFWSLKIIYFGHSAFFFLKDNYSIVLVFAMHQHGSAIGIHMFPPLWHFPFFFGHST